MYLIIDCQDSTGTWKGNTINQIKEFAEFVLMIGDTSWIRFKSGDTVESPCGRYEAQKVDGRTVKDIEWVWT